jgi:hypothetical protein
LKQNLGIFNLKNTALASKLSDILSELLKNGSRLPDPDFFPSRFPDPGVKKTTGSRIRIRNTFGLADCHWSVSSR